MKELKFMGNSQESLAEFPEQAKREMGFELWQVQLSLMPKDFKPMPTVGAGAYEIRVKLHGQWRDLCGQACRCGVRAALLS